VELKERSVLLGGRLRGNTEERRSGQADELNQNIVNDGLNHGIDADAHGE
jgi:hypothetical protein